MNRTQQEEEEDSPGKLFLARMSNKVHFSNNCWSRAQRNNRTNKQSNKTWGGAIVHWIRLRFPSCSPGFESQVHNLRFYIILFELWNVEKTKINKMKPGLTHFLKHYLIKLNQAVGSGCGSVGREIVSIPEVRRSNTVIGKIL